jgi:hypothetical protein
MTDKCCKNCVYCDEDCMPLTGFNVHGEFLNLCCEFKPKDEEQK